MSGPPVALKTDHLLKPPALNQHCSDSVSNPPSLTCLRSGVRIQIMRGTCLDNGSPFYYLLEARLIIFPLIRFASPRREPASPDAQISFAVVCLSGPLHDTTKKQTTQITSDHEKQFKHLAKKKTTTTTNTQHLRPGMWMINTHTLVALG